MTAGSQILSYFEDRLSAFRYVIDPASEATNLEQIPNIGKSIAQDLRNIGILRPSQLIGKDGLKLYEKVNRVTGVRHDPCLADTFMAAVDFMNGGKAKPWWTFTAKRKQLLKT